MSGKEIPINHGDACSKFLKDESLNNKSNSTVSDVEIDIVALVEELITFFPLDRVDWSAGYDQYLFDLRKTVIDNYEKGNYQVSYFYAHLIFMSYVYYSVEKVHQFKPERLKDIYYPINAYNGRQDKPDLDNYNSVYDFSKIPEKEIFKIFYIMGMETSQVRSMVSYISSRDNYAHATGKGNILLDNLELNLKTIKANMENLHNVFKIDLKNLYRQFLLDNADKIYSVVQNNIETFITNNALSLCDLLYLINIGISKFRNEDGSFKLKYRSIKNVHCCFMEYCIENYSVPEPENYYSFRNEKYLFWLYKDNAENYIENELGINQYGCIKNGGEFPLYDCIDCFSKQMVYDEKKDNYHCFHCGVDYSGAELIHCQNCDILMPNNEIGICAECFRQKLDD